MSIGDDMYPLLRRAADALNGVQDQFRFELTHESCRTAALEFRRQEYLTDDIWKFLENQRRTGAPRQFILAFVNEPLRSFRYSNLFGSHKGEVGLAVVTISGSSQYVKDDERYCEYYMTRYALSFVNHSIKSHEEIENRDCYFHFKRNKNDIIYSMNSGKICDKCLNLLDHPPDIEAVYRLTDQERNALSRMREYVSGQYPYSLIMKGGGIKGLAIAGALIELGYYYSFNRHVGTSAGAIAAVLLAAGFKPDELKNILVQQDFSRFLDSPIWKWPFNIIVHGGLHSGNRIQSWISELLHSIILRISEIKMKHLPGSIIYATKPGEGTLVYDSEGENKEVAVDFAVRCSISIPFFFMPMRVEGRRVFDGGLRNNFPLRRFIERFPNAPFVAIYLESPKVSKNGWIVKELLEIFISGEERELVDENIKNVLVIDTNPISTFDFRLSDQEKSYLVAAGRASALEFLSKRGFENGPHCEEVQAARAIAKDLRAAINYQRKKRQFLRRVTVISLMLILILIYYFI
ncbi:patatin-like phospholipase family protein [Tistrella mobilis]